MRQLAQSLGIVLVFMSLSVSRAAFAWVDETNANFVLSRIDHRFSLPGLPVELVLQRTYNSTSTTRGLFGYGWCSTFETSLVVVSPEQVIIQECGDGRATVYSQPSMKTVSVDRIFDAAKAKLGELPSDFKKVLLEDAVFRAAIVKRVGIEIQVSDGSQFVSLAGERVKFAQRRFVRTRVTGAIDTFSQDGLLESVSTAGAKISFDYDKGRLRSMTDARGNRLFVRRNSQGLVSEITAPKQASSRYEYSAAGDLLNAKSSAGFEEHAYDSDHNMTLAKVGEAEVRLKYDVANDRVSELSYGGCRETYGYELKAGGSSKFSVDHKIACQGAEAKVTRTDYDYMSRADGTTAKMSQSLTDATGAKIETRYDDRGRMISRRSAEANADLIYSKDGRLTSFVSGALKYTYRYTVQGVLNDVQVAGGLKIHFTFDSRGRLLKLRDDRGRVLELDYKGLSLQADSVHLPGRLKVPLYATAASVAGRSPASLSDMTATLTLYDELYTPAIPALLGGRSAD